MLLNTNQIKWYSNLTSKPSLYSKTNHPSITSLNTTNLKQNIPLKKKKLSSKSSTPSTKRQNFFQEPKKSLPLCEKINQNEYSLDFPGKFDKKDFSNTAIFSNIHQDNYKIDPLIYHNEIFTARKQKLDQETLLKNYINNLSKLDESLYIENLCNIQEKKKEVYDVIKKNDTKPKYYEYFHKVINLPNNEEIPFTFPNKLPGNNVKKPEKSLREIRSIIKIQKFIKLHLQRKKFKKTSKVLSFLGKNLLEIALKTDLNEENCDTFQKTLRFQKNNASDMLKTSKFPIPKTNFMDPFKNDDGFSVISLFLKENPQKLPNLRLLNSDKPKTIANTTVCIPLTNQLINSESIETIPEYNETFENLTPNQSFLNKSRTIRESIIKESIEDEGGLIGSDILEESGLKPTKDIKDMSYEYEEEKFESISEEKSLKIISSSLSKKYDIEEIFKKNQNGNLKQFPEIKNSTSLETIPKPKKSVNFFPKPPSEKDLLKKDDNNNIIEEKKKDVIKKDLPTILIDDLDDTILEAKKKIESFNRHDGELAELKTNLFRTLNSLNNISSSSHKSYNNNIESEKTLGSTLYKKFQAEFSRLMNLKSANDYLDTYHKIERKNTLQNLVFKDLNKGDSNEGLNSDAKLQNFGVLLINLQNKQEVIFQTLLTLIQNNNSNQGLKEDIDNLKENQLEILMKMSEQYQKIEDLLEKQPTFITPQSKSIESPTIPKEHKEKPPAEDLSKEFFTPLKNEIIETQKHKTPLKIEEPAEISEYIDDFEVSTPKVPNIPFQKSFELQKSQNSAKISENPIIKSTENLAVDQIKSLSVISSDKEAETEEEDFSSVSWQNIISPIKLITQQVEKLSIEKITDNITEFILEKVYDDVLEKERLFPKRNMKEIQKFIDKTLVKKLKPSLNNSSQIIDDPMGALAFNRQELENDLISPSKTSIKKIAFNMDNFEEKSPTKLINLKRSSNDELLRSSLEMSVRNEGFINETEKAVRSLESKLRRRNNDEIIKDSVRLINEDFYNKINLFNENDLKERGNIIIDAFNEQMKINMIKELNKCMEKKNCFGGFEIKMEEIIITKRFNKICANTKKGLLKSIQNQLKENEDYTNVKELEFNQLYEYFKKEKYPFEEEENMGLMEFKVNHNWDELRKEVVDYVIIECTKDVIMELNRLGNKNNRKK